MPCCDAGCNGTLPSILFQMFLFFRFLDFFFIFFFLARFILQLEKKRKKKMKIEVLHCD